ncbi:hypothetical protein EUX98_g2703 [Antrodiella citrinella]|uniref:Nucleoside diphosphate kinase n=1 Tax=Antrodiella citrinella TaxID=2447956 RepID=A0A4S4N6M2_9APHY|nr:hypothetical protein EUX98_g2703 [Antrodiella citrinella]
MLANAARTQPRHFLVPTRSVRFLTTETITPSSSQLPPPHPPRHTTKPPSKSRINPAPRRATPHNRHQALPTLPPSFGRNQILPVADSTRALLESIVAQFNAPIRYAFAYGSGVFEQDGYQAMSKASQEPPMLDFLFAVTHAQHWHSINMSQYPGHYPLYARALGSSFVSRVEEVNPGVWFNAFVPMNGVTIKYGVTTVDNLCSDLLNWHSLYLAGRMHKPIRIIKDDARVRLTQQVNLTSAVRTALLTLPENFSETELFERITGFSYAGDLRMSLPAENRGKVGNIVRKQGPQFKELYHRLVVALPGVHWPDYSSSIQQDMSPHTRAAHLRKLPSHLSAMVTTHFDSAGLPPRESDESMYWSRLAGDARLPQVLQQEMVKIVRYPSAVQSLKGIVSAGVGKSLRYSSAKIAKERQVEFDVETDPETLFELFGADYESFAEGPVWVYVLERRRAVEVWNTLMGDPDPEVAREETTNSLRALYGIDKQQNAVMGSANAEIAEIQIQAIFSSSPPFPNSELPDVGNSTSRSTSSFILASEDGYASATTSDRNRKSLFRARPLPATHDQPDIVPRMTKAAALRAGIVITSPERAPPTKERLKQTFLNVPGHKRQEVISVASTAPPIVAPRMTRAASLRLGQALPPKPARPSVSKETTFEGVPGHKRRESISVASTKAPVVAVRSNRSASLRVQKEVAPPTSYMFRSSSKEAAAPSRSSSRQSLNLPDSARPTFSRPDSSASAYASAYTSRTAAPRGSTGAPPSAFSARGSAEHSRTAPTPPPRPPSTQPAPPTIAPRTNKSALLRAAKMATIAAAKAATSPGKKVMSQKTVSV